MKVLALGILLVSLYCIEGAVVKREAEGEGQPDTTASGIASNFSQYLQSFADYFKKDFTEYAAQTRALLEQVKENVFNEQMTDRIRQAFDGMVESAKAAIQ